MSISEKIDLKTKDIVLENINKIAKLFPNCLTETVNSEGKLQLAIDFDKLRQELSSCVVEGDQERYVFSWPDKRKAVLLANAPTTKTLRPVRNESVDFDTTKNLYIEGDNLDVLKCLREAYLGKVKMIYIDPPYNTGSDFVYEDDFFDNIDDYLKKSNQIDAKGNRLKANMETNGRFHTDWLNMIYPRLKVARDFLTDDGVIFISIDDHEVDNLRKVCNEIFGEKNYIATLIWQRAYSPKNDAKFVSSSHDYVVAYSKNIDSFKIGRLPRTEEANARYSNPDNDPRGVWKSTDLSVKTYNPQTDYQITTPSGRIVSPPSGGCWRLSREAFEERLKDNRIWFGTDGSAVPSIKRFLSELKFEGMAPTSLLFYKDVGHSQEGVKDLVEVLGNKGAFDGPKPLRLIQHLMILANLNDDSIVMDFYSGSATTAHAVLKSNAENGYQRRFIAVQIPADFPDNRNPLGLENLAKVGLERIRKYAAHLHERPTLGNAQDLGYRLFKLDESNMVPVHYRPEEVTQGDLFSQADNVKADRTSEDLLFQVMLALGATLDCPIERKLISGKEVFNVDDGYILACFERNVTNTVVEAMAKEEPRFVVMRDASFSSDSVADNFEQIFKTYAPNTVCKVI